MTLGTRVTVVVTLLVAAVLAGSGYAALKVRRANLEADLDREAHEIATALRAGIEPLDRGTAEEMLLARARAARQHDELFGLEVLSIGSEQRTDDDAWLLLMRAADIQDAPVGRLFDSSSGPRSYAMAVPLFDAAALELPPAPPGAPPDGDHGDAARRRLHRRRGGGHRAPDLPALPAGGDRRGDRRALRDRADRGAAAAPPAGGDRRRRQGRSVARHPGRA